MIDLVDDLILQLKKRGMAVVWKSDTELSLTGNTKDADPDVMAALKKFKPRLLERLKPKNPPVAPAQNQ